MRESKVMSTREAVSKFIENGMTVAIGGFFHADLLCNYS